MEVFAFQPEDFRETFERQGWVHIKRGIDPTFLKVSSDYAGHRIAGNRLTGAGITGHKDQFLFEFPDSVHLETQVFDVLAKFTGLNGSTITLSERHIKAYSQDADPFPVPHKDRLSSQIAVGLSLHVPKNSHLVLYPYDHLETNPFLTTGLRDTLGPEDLPEVVLRNSPQVEIHDSPGDVIAFRGSSIWHLRRHAAGTVNLYLKFNDFDADPLGEDPSTETRRSATIAALDEETTDPSDWLPVLSRRFDSIVASRSRYQWRESLSAIIWDRPPLPLSATDHAVLSSLNTGKTWSEISRSLDGVTVKDAQASLRGLAANGAVDLVQRQPSLTGTLVRA